MQVSTIKTHLDGPTAFTTGIGDLEIVTISGATYLVSVSGATGGISTYQVDTGGTAAAVLLDQESHAANTILIFPNPADDVEYFVRLVGNGNTGIVFGVVKLVLQPVVTLFKG